MDDVARKARVSRALVYLYFKNKIELQFAICLRALNLLREQLAAAAETPPRGDDKIAAIGAAYMRFAEQHPLYFATLRSEEHTSELQSLMRISYAVFCLKKKNNKNNKVTKIIQYPQ